MRDYPDRRAVAIVACDGVTVFELGVACDIFGGEWEAMFGVPPYRSFVCGLTPRPVAPTAGSRSSPVTDSSESVLRATVIMLPTRAFTEVPQCSTPCGRLTTRSASSPCPPGAFALAAAGLLGGRRHDALDGM